MAKKLQKKLNREVEKTRAECEGLSAYEIQQRIEAQRQQNEYEYLRLRQEIEQNEQEKKQAKEVTLGTAITYLASSTGQDDNPTIRGAMYASGAFWAYRGAKDLLNKRKFKKLQEKGVIKECALEEIRDERYK
ncbi:MAG: hypothetical protein J6C13_04955 [Clostridia bacterium]|nr:hypothetical protein [Clostridia bacterium]